MATIRPSPYPDLAANCFAPKREEPTGLKEPTIQSQVDTLDEQLQKLSSLIFDLNTRLSPVLRKQVAKDSTAGAGDTKPNPSASVIRDSLDKLTADTRNLQVYLDNIISSIDL